MGGSHRPSKFDISKYKLILDFHKLKCLEFTASLSRLWECITCLHKHGNHRARQIIKLSLKNATTLTDYQGKFECFRCRYPKKTTIADCASQLQHHSTNIERYPSTLHTSMLEDACMVVFAAPFNMQRGCIACIQNTFKTRYKPIKLTQSSILFETSINQLKGMRKSLVQIRRCHTIDTCRRIQLVPHQFCVKHRNFEFVDFNQANLESRDTSQVYNLTEKNIPVGIWPPNFHNSSPGIKHWVQLSYMRSVTLNWPTYNTIALVEVVSQPLSLDGCIICFIQQTEVFFVHTKINTPSGYVWMRQADSRMLQLCLEEHCKRLTYREDRHHIERPIGLRRWTVRDMNSRRYNDRKNQ